jgi:riboflavin biosynthesis pyrimidine reductase
MISLVVQLSLAFTSQKFSYAFPCSCSSITVVRRIAFSLFDNKVTGLGMEPDKNSSNVVVGAVGGVTLKMAFDTSPVWGVADLSEAKSERFTSPASLDLVHRLRRVSDCVLVGKGTVERDNCTLTVRRVPLPKDRPYQPTRVVLDPALTLFNYSSEQRKFEIFHDGLATLVYYSPSSVSIEMINNITEEKNSERKWNEKLTLVAITELPQGASSTLGSKRYISPKQIVQDLTKRGIHHIMVEGGE